MDEEKIYKDPKKAAKVLNLDKKKMHMINDLLEFKMRPKIEYNACIYTFTCKDSEFLVNIGGSNFKCADPSLRGGLFFDKGINLKD